MNRTNQISANAVPYVIVVFLLVTLLASRSYAETCVGTSLRICVDFISAGNPVFPNDFNVVGDNLILKIGAEDWRVWSQVSASDTTPADFGSITLNPTVPADNFEVEIKNGTTGGAGAANVGSIVLDDAGFTGYSNLGATTIDGHVTGAITLVDDGAMPPQGGEVTGAVVIGLGVFPLGGVDGPITITKVSAFVTIFGSVDGSITITQVSAPVSIFGSVVGPITIPKINASVSIYGDYGDDNASHNIDLGVIANNAGFSIGGDILSDETNTLAIDIEALGDIATGTAGSFAVGGSLTNPLATVTITDMKVIAGAGSIVRFGGDFGGILDLKKGVPGAIADNIVKIIGELLCTGGSCVGGKIKLNGMDIGGQLLLGATAQGSEVLNGGQITGIFYPCEDIGNFAGEATFTGVAAGGQIYAFDVNPPFKADVSGDITINGDYVGLFKVDGDFTSTASLTITGDLKANAGDDGLIWIVEEAAGDVTIKKDLIGHVHYPKTFATNGSVTVEGNVTSSGLFKTGDLATGETHDGDLIFQGNVVGDILIHGNMSGDVTITDDQSGDLAIDEGLSGSITVGGALANAGLGGGRIMIAGESSGPIKVGKKTGSLTLIQVAGGLAAGATIEINTTQGPFNAVGDMHIGGTTPAALPFDGCIRIYGQSLTGNHGHLKGDLDIVMCHPNGHQLLICIDGDDAGNVTLDQTGCIPANANWDCYSPGCP